MIYLLVGENKIKKDSEISKISGKSLLSNIDLFLWDSNLILGKIGSTSLFAEPKGGEEVLVLKDISEKEESWLELKNLSQELQDFRGKIIISERDLNKEDLSFFKDLGAKISDFREKKDFVYDFSPFALQDALGKAQAKDVWIEYVKLKSSGIQAEEIIPKILSKVRDMLAINMGADKADLSIKSDYPYNKSKRDFKNWKEPKLRELYSDLVHIYHDSRMGGEELEVSLEKRLLKI